MSRLNRSARNHWIANDVRLTILIGGRLPTCYCCGQKKVTRKHASRNGRGRSKWVWECHIKCRKDSRVNKRGKGKKERIQRKKVTLKLQLEREGERIPQPKKYTARKEKRKAEFKPQQMKPTIKAIHIHCLHPCHQLQRKKITMLKLMNATNISGDKLHLTSLFNLVEFIWNRLAVRIN